MGCLGFSNKTACAGRKLGGVDMWAVGFEEARSETSSDTRAGRYGMSLNRALCSPPSILSLEQYTHLESI